MEKKVYMAPEQEIIKLSYNTILMASGDNPQPGGNGDEVDE